MTTNTIKLNDVAVKIALKIIKNFEGCVLIAYPDPASPLSKALATHGLLDKYKAGKYKLEPQFKTLSASPVTIGYGEARNIKLGDVWTQQQADDNLKQRVQERMSAVLKASPALASMSPEATAACTSLCDNIGITAYTQQCSVPKKINAGDIAGAAKIFHEWNKADGKVLQGLVNRRKMESDLFLSV